jgi:hypothetical protein
MLLIRSFTLALLATAVLFISGCDSSDGDGPTSLGLSSINVTGAYTDSFQGSAVFSVVPDGEGGTAFVLMLFNGNMNDEDSVTKMASFARPGGRPGTGAFSIDFEDVTAFYASEINDEESVIFFGESGELTIISSTESLVKGEFTFVGAPFFGEEEDEDAIVAGTFEAARIHGGMLPGPAVFSAGAGN